MAETLLTIVRTLLPEIFILLSLVGILWLDLGNRPEKGAWMYRLSLVAVSGAAVLSVLLPDITYQVISHQAIFSGMLVQDGMAWMYKILICIGMFLFYVYTRESVRRDCMNQGAFYALSLFALLGMFVMVCAANLIMFYLGLELLALALYALILTFGHSVLSTEAAMKYFMMGALASGLLLYGMSMVYGATGTLVYREISSMLSLQGNSVLLTLGCVFIVCGLAFKMGVAPFHLWAPDVYHGAPLPVVLLIGSVPKLAVFIFAYRLLVLGLGGLFDEWQDMLIIIAVLSLLIGNLGAIAQDNLRRMLAYSAIAQMAFVAMGFAALDSLTPGNGVEAASAYVVTYVMMSLAAFGILLVLQLKGLPCEKLADLKGLGTQSRFYAFLFALVMFSMAGIPPFVGFFAKLLVIKALIGSGLVWLAIVAVILSVIGAFYYLRVVWYMYMETPEKAVTQVVPYQKRSLLLSLNALLLLGFGLINMPASMLEITHLFSPFF